MKYTRIIISAAAILLLAGQAAAQSQEEAERKEAQAAAAAEAAKARAESREDDFWLARPHNGPAAGPADDRGQGCAPRAGPHYTDSLDHHCHGLYFRPRFARP